eukprot:2116446-Pleurochrysis_carterae.AAC.1
MKTVRGTVISRWTPEKQPTSTNGSVPAATSAATRGSHRTPSRPTVTARCSRVRPHGDYLLMYRQNRQNERDCAREMRCTEQKGDRATREHFEESRTSQSPSNQDDSKRFKPGRLASNQGARGSKKRDLPVLNLAPSFTHTQSSFSRR